MSDLLTQHADAAATVPLTVDFAVPGGGAHRLVYAFDRASPVQEMMHDAIDSGKFYEPETTILLASVLKPGDVFVDVGAHVGYFTVLAASLVGPAGQVFSFEPEPRNYARLVEHLRLNGYRNVLPIHCAAGADEAVLELHCNADNDGGHALWDVGLHAYNEQSRATPRTHQVFVATLDLVLAGVTPGRIKAIKIDVEGNEHAVLLGARRTLDAHRVPFVVAEVNRTGLELLGTSESGLRAFMTILGYETWLIRDGEPQLVRLEPGQTVTSAFVFNLLFRRPGAAIG